MPKVVRSAPTASLEVFTSSGGEDCLGTVAFTVRDHLNAWTVTSMLQNDWRWAGGKVIRQMIVKGNILTLQRNECVWRMEGDFLIFIDDDMVWDANALGLLYASYKELRAMVEGPIILGGLCVKRSAPHEPTLFMRERPGEGSYNFLEQWETDLVEVDATGMAFCLIEKEVFEAIVGSPMPPLTVRNQAEPYPFYRWDGRVGEDLAFCADAKAAGARVFVDTRIKIGHLGEVNLGIRDFWAQVAQREPEIEEARRELNARMGLPTMTAAEARRRLGWQ